MSPETRDGFGPTDSAKSDALERVQALPLLRMLLALLREAQLHTTYYIHDGPLPGPDYGEASRPPAVRCVWGQRSARARSCRDGKRQGVMLADKVRLSGWKLGNAIFICSRAGWRGSIKSKIAFVGGVKSAGRGVEWT